MSNASLNFTIKFFRPPQRTVSCHNGLLDTRTKRTIAQDRLIVAEQRALDVEQRKSTNNLQLLKYEQKQLEKRLLSLQNLEQSSQIRRRSTSETNLHRLTSSETDKSEIQHRSVERIRSQRKLDRELSGRSDSENNDDDEEEEENVKPIDVRTIRIPIVTVIPPEENILMSL